MKFIFFLFFFLLNYQASANEILKIAVASNFVEPIKLIKKKFEEKNRMTLKIIKGSTSQLFSQIINNAPVEIFLSADQITPRKLPKSLIIENTQFTYAIGKLILWTTLKQNQPLNAVTFFKRVKINKLTIANPKFSPYGKSSKEFLKNIKVWKNINDKLVFANNINQVVSFLYSGNVKNGFISYSDKIKLKYNNKGMFLEVPETLYPKIKQDVIMLTKGRRNQFATIFLNFLKSSEIKEVIKSFGYGIN